MDYQTFSTKAISIVAGKDPATIRYRAKVLGIVPGGKGRYSAEQANQLVNFQRQPRVKPRVESVENEAEQLRRIVARMNAKRDQKVVIAI